MPCLLALIGFFLPRVVIVLLGLFTHYLHHAYETVLWPLLGFFFLPYTTLAYAWAVNTTSGNVRGLPLLIVVIAVLFDIGSIGSSGHSSYTRVVEVEKPRR